MDVNASRMSRPSLRTSTSPEKTLHTPAEKLKKPSYVGLSCSVSGYSNFNRYTSPEGKRNSPPSQIPVSSPPQTLDSVSLVLNQDLNMRQINDRSEGVRSNGHDMTDRGYFPHSTTVISRGSSTTTVETVTKFYSNSRREESPLSDSSTGADSNGSTGIGVNNNNNGNLVQKQIERLYGGKIRTIKVTSPPQQQDAEDRKSGFFTKRFGGQAISENGKERSRNGNGTGSSSPLEFKPLKVPAVFRLLRPEFREQLKNNSCQIPNDQTSPRSSPSRSIGRGERIIPIQMEGASPQPDQTRPAPKERTVPIDQTTKPSLPNKSPSPSNKSPITSPTHEVKSPNLVSNATTKLQRDEPLVTPGTEKVEPELQESEAVDPYEDEDVGGGGVHEKSFLGTILEEDNESTSGSHLNLAPKSPSQVVTAVAQNEQEKVQDGHYFIKLIENETFKFEEQICDFEEELNDPNLPEEAKENILAAVGKARLLMAQKLAQFRGLCEKNITLTVKEDPFVPTPGDLAGFWDMVFIQVEHIHSLFADLNTLRKNGWKRVEPIKTATPSPKSTNRPTKAKKVSPSNNNNKVSPKKPQSEAAKARDEARRKMLEERKRQMKLKQEGNAENDNFVQF